MRLKIILFFFLIKSDTYHLDQTPKSKLLFLSWWMRDILSRANSKWIYISHTQTHTSIHTHTDKAEASLLMSAVLMPQETLKFNHNAFWPHHFSTNDIKHPCLLAYLVRVHKQSFIPGLSNKTEKKLKQQPKRRKKHNYN